MWCRWFFSCGSAEILILLAGFLFILRKGLGAEDVGIVFFTAFTVVMAIYMSAINLMVFVDYLGTF